MDEQYERLFCLTEQLADCVQHLVALNNNMFHMIAMVTGIEGGAYKPVEEEVAPKFDLTGKPIR